MLKGKELLCKGLVYGWGIDGVYQRPPHQSTSLPDPGSPRNQLGSFLLNPCCCALSRARCPGRSGEGTGRKSANTDAEVVATNKRNARTVRGQVRMLVRVRDVPEETERGGGRTDWGTALRAKRGDARMRGGHGRKRCTPAGRSGADVATAPGGVGGRSHG
jgi:hypothetical protein